MGQVGFSHYFHVFFPFFFFSLTVTFLTIFTFLVFLCLCQLVKTAGMSGSEPCVVLWMLWTRLGPNPISRAEDAGEGTWTGTHAEKLS